jgi:hypothetical protein
VIIGDIVDRNFVNRNFKRLQVERRNPYNKEFGKTRKRETK